MIRAAVSYDMPLLLEMGARFHDAADLPFEYDPEASGAAIGGMIEDGGVFVSERGAIGGITGQAWSNPSHVFACELFWWSEDGHGIGLLKAFEDWAREMGACEVRMTSLHHLVKAGKILERLGYTPTEVSYGKVL